MLQAAKSQVRDPVRCMNFSNLTVNNTFCFATIDKVFYYVASVLTTCFGPYIRPSSGEFYLILPAALGPGIHSASNRNEYQEQRNNVSVE
jgi:hypothetical protein